MKDLVANRTGPKAQHMWASVSRRWWIKSRTLLFNCLAWISTAQNSPNISWGSAEAARVKIRGIGLHFMGAGLPIH